MIARTSTLSRWLAPAASDGHPLFCLPCAGGTARDYRAWVPLLADAGICVRPLLLPGREQRLSEAPVSSMTMLVDSVADVVADAVGDRSYSVFGHSMGALVAYEVARNLTDRGVPPATLVVAAHHAPHRTSLPRDDRVPDDEGVLRYMRQLNGLPDEVRLDPELLELLLPMFRADLTACSTYRYVESQPLGCPVSILGGLQDPALPRSALEEWSRHSNTSCVSMFEGDHFFTRTNSVAVLARVAQDIRAAQRT